VGLNFKLDIGLYQLDQQAACQRYRQNFVIAERKNLIADLTELFAPKQAALSVA
jgi:hypothetical protein